jgi:hypothetical protein
VTAGTVANSSTKGESPKNKIQRITKRIALAFVFVLLFAEWFHKKEQVLLEIGNTQ